MECVLYCVCEAIWRLLATKVRKLDLIYQLEKDIVYSEVEYTIYLERKPTYYIINIILPCSLLVIVSLLVSHSRVVFIYIIIFKLIYKAT